MTAGLVETPSGKGARDENFPVGSWLLPARLRPHVAVFYTFARAIDDIADNSGLAPEDKIARLQGFDDAVTGRTSGVPGYRTGDRMAESLAETGVSPRHCRDLIAAFKQDAVKQRYADWGELMGYCTLSASPVGRYLLDLHGEDPSGYAASDPLCNALQVLNHVQDCQDDYRALDRVYLPQDWMADEGVSVEALDAASSPPGLRRVIDRCLDGSDALLSATRPLPGRLKSRRLAAESEMTIRLALRLAARLRRGDPLARRVALSRGDFVCAAIGAVAATLLGVR